MCGWGDYLPHNEFGLVSNIIISPASARRLHLLYERIDLEILRERFPDHFADIDVSPASGYCSNFDELGESLEA